MEKKYDYNHGEKSVFNKINILTHGKIWCMVKNYAKLGNVFNLLSSKSCL